MDACTRGTRGMHHSNVTMVTKEKCILGEAEKVLDCLTMKSFFFAGVTITENFNANTKY